jgi:zinc protease
VDNLKQVTPEQIQAVAKKYLKKNNLSVAVLDPLPIEQQAQRQTIGGRHGS